MANRWCSRRKIATPRTGRPSRRYPGRPPKARIADPRDRTNARVGTRCMIYEINPSVNTHPPQPSWPDGAAFPGRVLPAREGRRWKRPGGLAAWLCTGTCFLLFLGAIPGLRASSTLDRRQRAPQSVSRWSVCTSRMPPVTGAQCSTNVRICQVRRWGWRGRFWTGRIAHLLKVWGECDIMKAPKTRTVMACLV